MDMAWMQMTAEPWQHLNKMYIVYVFFCMYCICIILIKMFIILAA